MRLSPRVRGFLLVDVMLGVAIFSMGIIALGMAVNNCLDGQTALREAALARQILENRMSEILANAVTVEPESRQELEGEGAGITLEQTAVPLEAEDENGNKVTGLQVVTLSAVWESGGEEQRTDVTFYMPGGSNATITQ